MRKIATLFDRDWEGHPGVVPRWSADAARVLAGFPGSLRPTEKLDGTNVRLTIRSGIVVRVEKRRNPSKDQKAQGITEPWYADAADGAEDRYIREAAEHVDLAGVADGEWSGEAIGPKIQGNPLALDGPHRVVLFGAGQAPYLSDAPGISDAAGTFDRLREYLATKRSALNPGVGIEGIVWRDPFFDDHLKIKAKDFRASLSPRSTIEAEES